MKPIISVKNLGKNYPVPIKQNFWRTMIWPKYTQLTAVENINFEIEKGEAVGLLGPNGAGKTTTLKMLSGLLEPSSGEISVIGFSPHQRKRNFLKQIGMVMGNKNSLSWELSGLQNFMVLESIYEIDHVQISNQIDELAEILEVQNLLDRPIRKLSLGQRLKMELIGSILHKPKLLFLDEPTLGLDIIAKRRIRDFIKKSNETEGTTIILTSHDMADVEKIVNRILVINQGKLIFDGSMKKLLDQYKARKYLIVYLENPVIKSSIEKLGKIIEWKEFSFTIEIEKIKQSQIISEITDKYEVDDLDISSVPLEEIIADLFVTGSDNSLLTR